MQSSVWAGTLKDAEQEVGVSSTRLLLLATRPSAVPSSRRFPTTAFLRFAQLLSLATFKHLLGLGPGPGNASGSSSCIQMIQTETTPCGQTPGVRGDTDPQKADNPKEQTSERDASRGLTLGLLG